ncbi:MAG: SWIM zinc finger domain-containing protein [Propionibacteriaceae bacterium]|jgi:hypothetical protein|nr:SWIM zinc finger domain-containing protein [Propionibacteriaceae bacterium]
MDQRWQLVKVWASAPDDNSKAAGRKLAASAAIWSDTGCEADLVWGSCQGSGKNPYRVRVDTSGPRYKCSCPSRKFPCKHALGLLTLWAEHRLPSDTGAVTARPDDAAAWAAAPAQKAKAARADAAPTPEQAAQAAARLEQREQRVSDGMAELERWLRDQLDTGLARAWNDPAAHFEAAASRMVDAQAPGVAQTLRGLVPVAVSGEGWVGRILEEYALLHLAARAWERRAELPADLCQTVRRVVGLTTAAKDVAAGEGRRGLWLVAGLRDIEDGKLCSRRVWLHALDPADDRPWASVVTHTVRGQAPDNSLAPGTVVDAVLHRYPGSGNHRAHISQRFSETQASQVPGWQPPTSSFQELVAGHRDLLTGDPWAQVSPAAARIRTVHRDGHGWRGADDAGDQVSLLGGELDLWRLHGLLAGQPGVVLGEWDATGLRPAGLVTASGLELL